MTDSQIIDQIIRDEGGLGNLRADEFVSPGNATSGHTVSHVVGKANPSAVPGFVMPVVVDSVQSESRRAWSHVGQERGEIVSPFLANRHTPAAIAEPLRIIGFGTPFVHVAPSPVFTSFSGRPSRASGCAVLDCSRRRGLVPQAPTTLGCPRPKRGSLNLVHVSAPTPTQPKDSPSTARPAAFSHLNFQPSERLSCQIQGFHRSSSRD